MDERKVAAARALEQRGRREEAVHAYAQAGAVEDAARLLTDERRFGEAAALLVESLGIPPQEAGRLAPALRSRAHRAAGLLARAGEADAAAELYLALDDPERALQALVQNKRHPAAAQLAERLGRKAQAGELYAMAGLFIESGTCLAAAGDATGALEQLRRVSRDAPRYREACVIAAPLARSLGALSFELEQFFAHFLDTSPAGADELAAFYELGRLYLEHGPAHDARLAFLKLLEVDANYRDAAVHLAFLEAERPPASDEALPDLPELPELPDPASLRTQHVAAPLAAGPLFVVGAVIAERYRLEARIGTGGMAVVFRASDLEIGEEIALKVFTQVLHDERAEERFKRELKLSRQLSDPHVVRLYDIGSWRGCRYISMELLKGQDLRARMASPLAYADALDYLVQICGGLQAAHAAGVVHRDLKPENCFVTDGGLVKVMDFGIAKVQNAPGLTTTGIIAGTPAYISPEQVSSFSEVGPAADLYALGVIAYEIFTGRLPFSHDEPLRLLMMHVNDQPAPPRSVNPAIPVALERIIRRLLEKSPARRFASASELAAALAAVRGQLPA